MEQGHFAHRGSYEFATKAKITSLMDNLGIVHFRKSIIGLLLPRFFGTALLVFILSSIAYGSDELGNRDADSKDDAERFRLWKTLTENEPHRGVKLLVEVDIRFFGKNEKRYLVCTRSGQNFVVHVLDKAPRKLKGEYQYEFNFRTEHFGFSSEEGYWRLENGTAYLLGDGVYPEGTEAWKEVDFLLGSKLLRGRDVMNMGFFNVPMGEIRWDGAKFAATNIYDQPVFGEIVETERGLPTKAIFTVYTKEVGMGTNYLEYAYSTKRGGQAVVPRLISKAGDNANIGISYRILSAQFVNDPQRLFSMNHYLNSGVGELVDYTEKGDMTSREFDLSRDRKIFVLGEWRSQKSVSLLMMLVVGVVILGFVGIALKQRKKMLVLSEAKERDKNE